MRRQLTVALMISLVSATACGDRDNEATMDSMAGRLDSAGTAATDETVMRDGDIFASMTASNSSEVALGKLGVDSATNAEVKEFARMMVTDHESMNKEVHNVALALDLVSQSGDRTEDVVDDSKDRMDNLKGKHGADFDREFMDIMVESHESTLKMLDKAASSTGTAQLVTAINAARPKVEQHLSRAKSIRDNLNR